VSEPTESPTLARLRAAKSGDLDAYDELFANTVDRLQLFLRVRLGQGLRLAEESADLLQETYLAAHQAFANFEIPATGDPERAFFGWLCTIAENCIRRRADHHGAQKRRPKGKLQRISRIMEGVSAGSLGPATRAERLDQRHRLAQAMLQLEDGPRQLLVLHHFENLSGAEIARRTQRSESSVRRDLAAAVRQLGAALKEVDA
jgi:RNA polymerase sigma-70 factor (ECF subfamily)